MIAHYFIGSYVDIVPFGVKPKMTEKPSSESKQCHPTHVEYPNSLAENDNWSGTFMQTAVVCLFVALDWFFSLHVFVITVFKFGVWTRQ